MAKHSSSFVWHDLMTNDVEGAKRFYGALLGWKFDRGEGGPYEHITAGSRMIGGMMKQQQPKGPPHWMGYVSVENVDRTVETATRNGGKVYAPPMDVPNVGRFAVVADGQGAVFAPFKDAGVHPPEPETTGRPTPNTFCWDELLTSDPAAAAKFYGSVFGWGAESMAMPGFGTYTLLKRTGVKDETGADRSAAGVMQSQPNAQHPPFWLTYVAVTDADGTARKLRELGGKVMMDPMDIPNVGRFFPAMDPQGAAIGFLAPPR